MIIFQNQVFYVLIITIIDFDTWPDTQQGFGAISNTCPTLEKTQTKLRW
jgi:hypothetical protein